MSFILEAIRRSEEARHKRLIPDVSTVHAVRPAPGRAGPQRLYVMIALAVVLAFAATLRWWAWQAGQQDPAVAASSVAPAPAAVAERAAKVPPPPPAAAAPAPQPEGAPGQVATGTPAGSAGTSAAGEESAEAKRPRRPYSSPASGDAKPRREPRAAAAAPALKPGMGGEGQGGVEALPPPPTASELVTATALRDLPPSVQRTLPSIAITLHRYAASTDARMIRVNGRVAREGDLIGGDLSVAEITRSGVVFAIGGQRFYMDAFQTWQAKTGS